MKINLAARSLDQTSVRFFPLGRVSLILLRLAELQKSPIGSNRRVYLTRVIFGSSSSGYWSCGQFIARADLVICINPIGATHACDVNRPLAWRVPYPLCNSLAKNGEPHWADAIKASSARRVENISISNMLCKAVFNVFYFYYFAFL